MKASLSQMNHLIVLIIGSILLVSLPIPSCFATVAAFSSMTNPTFRNHRNGVAVVVVPREISHLFLADKNEEAVTSPPAPPVRCPNCELCDGSGKIAGGLGAILPWLPVKAYRPCPNFIANGGFYERQGQPLDEIAFGRDSTYDRK